MIIQSRARDGLGTITPSTEPKRNLYELNRSYQVIPWTALWENCTTIERANGCVWSEMFRNVDEVGRNSGSVIGGAPVDDGVTLDGSTQRVDYVENGELEKTKQSVAIEFYPDFAADDSAFHYWMDTDTNSVSMYHRNDNSLRLNLGGTLVLNIALGSYSAHWVTGGRNVIVLAGTTGNNAAYLNGNSIGTSGTAWTAAASAAIKLGSSSSNTGLFDGRITKVQIYDTLITAAGAAAMYNQGTFNNSAAMSA
jgi:hypothetical protein